MKNSKAIIAVVCALVLIFSLAACAAQKAKTEEITQVVTDENGEVVTDKNGEALTEEIQAQIVTDANGKAVTEVVTDQNGKPLTTVKDNKYVNVTQVVTISNSTSSQTPTTKSKKKSKSDKKESSTTKKASSVKAPDAITKLSASSIEKTSFKLSWNKVKCSGYYVMFSVDNGAHWSYFERAYTKTSYTAKNLISDQNYLIQVLAFNKSESGKVYKGKAKQITVKTKENTKKRKIKINVVLPVDANQKDDLIISIDGKTIDEKTVKLDGSTYTVTTEKEYKGEVEITAELKSHGIQTVLTDKEECFLEVPLGKIPVLIDDED